ncbi:hypothetical protein [Intestinimonas butyriciproducens]|uniref:hypothetical protein n=1 Tax=Intestinimonas butyriciproducens TaxID=1297617 RepID=UPI00051C7621|nr:hypothetical protein [Intestinimonas butyriciproducens]
MTDQEIKAMLAENNDTLLKAIGQMFQDQREEISGIKEEISIIKEDLEEVRTGVNTLLDWAERTSHVLEFPLPKVIE